VKFHEETIEQAERRGYELALSKFREYLENYRMNYCQEDGDGDNLMLFDVLPNCNKEIEMMWDGYPTYEQAISERDKDKKCR
jgi:hypothetical protein